MKKLLIEILQELKSINKKLQAIESSKEQSVTYNCIICQDPAHLVLENNQHICDTCAQIQGELSPN